MPKPTQEELALSHRKPCSLCQTPRDVLIRCQIDASGKWNFVCPGKCWKSVSGGMIDGDAEKAVGGKGGKGGDGEGNGEGGWYRYGGMWKNKHAGVSAKVPKRLKGKLTGKGSSSISDAATTTDDGTAGSGSQADGESAAGSSKVAKRSKGRMARKGRALDQESEGSEGSDGSDGSDGSEGSEGSEGSGGSDRSDEQGDEGVESSSETTHDSTMQRAYDEGTAKSLATPSEPTDETKTDPSMTSEQSQTDASTNAT